MTCRAEGSAVRISARRVAVLAGLFVAVLAAGLGRAWLGSRGFAVQDSQQLAALKRQLAEHPDDEGLKERIRRADLAVRSRHAEQLRFMQTGALLLVAGLGVLVASLRVAGLAREAEPSVPRTDRSGKHVGTFATGAVAALVCGVSLTVLFGMGVQEETGAVEQAGPSLDLRWGRFRGPGGLGRYAGEVRLPRNEANVLWRARLSVPGKGSPVAWGDSVYVSAADGRRRAVYAFDARSGQSLWTAECPALPGRDDTDLRVLPDTGYAAATCCTDGQRVFAIFANGDLVAVDAASGQIAWAKAMGIPANQYGLAASLVMAEGKLIVPFDQMFAESTDSEEQRHSRSKLAALDPATGEVLWEVARDVPDSWTTPLVTELGGREQIVTSANPWVIAYGPDGAELWRARCMAGDVAPSPVQAGAKVCVTNTGVGLFAIDPSGAGDVTESGIVWRKTESPWPDIISPAGSQRYVVTLTTEGFARCFDVADGREVWRRELEGRYYASPTVVGEGLDELLLLSEAGRFMKVRLGERFEELSTWSLGEDCYGSPAFGRGRLFVRGRYHLYCLDVGGE